MKKTQQQNLHKELSISLESIPIKLFYSHVLEKKKSHTVKN